jgi:20S proteasome alpha/beta subunit
MKPHIMTKYSFFLIILVLNTLLVKAQDPTNPGKQYIPNITTASPQVTSMSKVGEIPIDISTGRINYTIPIFEIQEGGFTMPINLSYNYSGLLLDETPGYAGVGWTFNIGGAILHSINGLNDENYENHKTAIDAYVNKQPPYNDTSSLETQTLISHLLGNISNGIVDGEPDKYTINIGNINCSFYLDKSNNPIFLKNENYKLTGNSSAGFTLTDDQGINYVFDSALTATKSTIENDFDYNSSFLLSEINFPNTTNKILLQYDANPGSYTDTNISQTLIKTTNQFGNPDNDFSLRTNDISTFLSIRNLSKIITNNYTIELQYNHNPVEPAISVINNLTIKDNFKNSVKKYDFTFSPWAGRRINLLNVKYNGQIVNEMEYEMSVPYPLPSQNNYHIKKDLWGYYNANALPVISGGLTTPYDNPSIKPDFSSVKIGALKRITYQTKGYSLIEYEPNTVYLKSNDYNFPYDSDGTMTSNVHVGTMAGQELNIDIQPFTVSTVPTELNLLYNFTNHTQINPYDNRETEVLLFKEGQEARPNFSTKQPWLWEERWIPTDLIITGVKKIAINEIGTYYIKASSTIGASAALGFDLKQRPTFFNQTVGGLRVKQVKNCDFNDQCITTVYNYSQAGNSTGIMLQKPEFYSGYFIQDNTQCSRGTYIKQEYFNYNSILPLSNFRGSPVLYKTVEKIDFSKDKNDQLVSNGRTIFSYYGNEVSNSLQDEESYFTIGLLDTKLVKDESNTKVTKQKNNYLTQAKPDVTKYVYALECRAVLERRWQAAGGLGGGCVLGYPRSLSDFKLGTFKHEAKNYKLQKEEKCSYFKGDSIVQTTEYNYNLSTGFLKSQKSTTSTVDEVKETQYSYPQDLPNELIVPDLIAKNMIGVPLKTEILRNKVKLSDQKTEYIKTADNLLLPKFVYAKKGEGDIDKSVDKKITYDQYDNKGNVLQYTPESGSPVAIIWGYNQTQPIAKIENVIYTTISSGTITNLQALSDADNDNCSSGSCKEQLLRNGLNTFRSSLLDAMITTYTYNPLIGVTSITDAKGLSSYYEYDSVNRLLIIKDQDLNILQRYCYNYKGQQIDCTDLIPSVVYKSIARSGSFSKNDCGNGVGSTVAFTLPEGAVTSKSSQTDADAQALIKFNADGQAYANNNAKCTFSSVAISGSFNKSNCPSGDVGSAVSYTLAEGSSISFISQANADAQALAKFNTQAQVNADVNGTCPFRSIARSGSFTKDNCTVGGVGSALTYSQSVGAVTSFISQTDADAKGLTKFNTVGQTYANVSGTCTFSSVAKSGSFTRNNCAAGGTPSTVTYTVVANMYNSIISQADADNLAQTNVNNNGQAYANTNGTCTFKNVAKSGSFTRNNCAAGGTPSTVAYTVAANTYASIISQADADNQAQSNVNNNGQAYTNTNGTCTFKNVAKSGSFTRNNCAAGGTPSPETYTVAANTYASIVSQADADNQAQTNVNNNGQAYANSNAKCTFSSIAKSGTATKNNCASGDVGSSVTYTVVAGAYSSISSQADADNQAQVNVNNNVQVYANASGTCTTATYNAIMVDFDSNMSKVWITVTSSSANHPAITIRPTISYDYQVNKIARKTVSLILPTGQTGVTFAVPLTFISHAELESFSVN